MATIRTYERQYENLKSRTNFTMLVKGSTETYTIGSNTKIKYYANPNKFPERLMYLFSKVRNQAIKLESEGRFRYFEGDRPTYIMDYETLRAKDGFVDCVEIDIKSAYWKTANKLGIVDNDTFIKFYGLKGEEKLCRNATIGALNSRGYIYNCPMGLNNEDKLIGTIDPPAKLAYKAVVCTVFSFISDLAEVLDPLFFWVDQLYVLDNGSVASGRVMDICKKWSYEVNFTKYKVCRIDNKFVVIDENGEFRDFNIR